MQKNFVIRFFLACAFLLPSCWAGKLTPEDEIAFLAGEYILQSGEGLASDERYRLAVKTDFTYDLVYFTSEGERKTYWNGFLLTQIDKPPTYGYEAADSFDTAGVRLYRLNRSPFFPDASIPNFRIGTVFYHYDKAEKSPFGVDVFLYDASYVLSDENGEPVWFPGLLWVKASK